MLDAAIEAVFTDNIHNIYFEGNLSGYTYMKEGGGLYDILNLLQGKNTKIHDPFISSFQTIAELDEYQSATGDKEIKLMSNIVKKYNKSLSFYLTNLKKYQVPKQEAALIFSTVHKAKGMEYKNVTLCDDFINKDTILELLNPSLDIDSPESDLLESETIVDTAKIVEEINILYVAITRAKENIEYSEFNEPEINNG